MKFGPYFLESRIAVGGTAEVYVARPTDPKSEPQKLVVKRMLPDFLTDSEGRTMFAREAELHASVHHPNVVKVFASGQTEDGEPYLAMELVDGLDAQRLLRRVKQESGRGIATGVAVYLAHEVLRALASVHSAKDAAGKALAIVHRDVTPSNIYLSRSGDVKLGDFGIARGSEKATLKSTAAGMLKGKFAYLAPEQVAGEPVDSRADLFSLATVLSEFLIGEPLFPGQGQLAVLLAIRDVRIDALRAIESTLPKGLFQALLKGLARDVDKRWRTAGEFADAIAPFMSKSGRAELMALVSTALTGTRESSRKMAIAAPAEIDDRATGEYTTQPSFVRTRHGVQHGPWQFARIVEAIATGEIGRGDAVDYMGQGYRPVEDVEDLARFLPMATPQTSRVEGPGKPDLALDLSRISMLEVLLSMLERDETGVLFAERDGRSARKELYFVRGRLHHVASSNASELLGEYLVRRGKIKREELDMALAVLPRNQGRMGDTLISLGLVSSVDIFQTIRDQGRDRVADLFMWKSGQLAFYRNQIAQHVEFPLDLDLAGLILAGMEAAVPGESALERYRTRLHHVLGPGRRDRPGLLHVKWPPQISAIEALARRPRRLSEVLSDATRGGHTTAGSVLRVVDVLLAARMLELVPR
ncbi:MAG TPA: serine/threonine-protein kinase [Polyangiaceae bacterium]